MPSVFVYKAKSEIKMKFSCGHDEILFILNFELDKLYIKLCKVCFIDR